MIFCNQIARCTNKKSTINSALCNVYNAPKKDHNMHKKEGLTL